MKNIKVVGDVTMVREKEKDKWLAGAHPTGAWRLIYLLRRRVSINSKRARAGLASDSCIGEIMASHERRLEGSTSFARRLNLAGQARSRVDNQKLLGTVAFA